MSNLLDIVAPPEQEGTKSVVRGWLKAIGDRLNENEPLVELETDKVTMEVPAPASGVLVEICSESGVEAAPGTILGRIRIDAPGVVEAMEAKATRNATQSDSPAAEKDGASARSLGSFAPQLRLSPAVRRALLQHSLDPAAIQGTGRDGRLTRADVERAAEARKAAPAAPRPAPQPAPQPAPTPASGERSRIVPHSPMRRRIAEHMAHSVSTAPHVTAVFEADFSAIIAHRNAHKAEFAREGINLTYTAYIIAACVEAMKAAPTVNSRWHEDHLEIFDDINIGVGTALGDEGLIVPVVHKAQELSLKGIAARLHDMTERARAGKLTPADVRGGTFSISNHGVSGSLVASPIIINQPQSAILGVGKLEKRVVVRTVDGVDSMQIRPMAYVSLSIDHRVIDGHQTNKWLSRFVEVLESWPR